ncbi:MAG: acyltransferase [Pseudomonadota bacterium]
MSSFTKIKATHGEVRLGARTSIATGCFISAGENGTLIGSDCLIGPNTTIVSGAWRFSRLDETFESQGQSSKGTVIGDNVFVGAGSAILDGARIGSGVMIGANSVVSGTVPDNAIVQGNPAKVVFVRR